MGGAWFAGDGTKSMACPNCGRILEVDLDDILPVHSKGIRITLHDGQPLQQETVNDLCDGSWNVKGVLMTITFLPGGSLLKKKKGE